jgi:hypothetical protein
LYGKRVFVFQLPPSGTLALLADFGVVSEHFFCFLGVNLTQKKSQKPLRVVRENSLSAASEIPRTALKPYSLTPVTASNRVAARNGRFCSLCLEEEVCPDYSFTQGESGFGE